MFNEFDQRSGDDLFEEVTVQNVADVGEVRLQLAIEFAVRHADVSAPIPIGTVYLQGTFGQLRQAAQTQIPRLLRNLEAGIPATWGTALPSTSDGAAVSFAAMAKPRVVRSGGKRR